MARQKLPGSSDKRHVMGYHCAYDVLGVPDNASQEEIMQAYREALRHAHPDHMGEYGYSIQTVRAAFEILRDPVQRARYDQGFKRAQKLETQAKVLRAINDNGKQVESRASQVISTLGAIFWPFQTRE